MSLKLINITPIGMKYFSILFIFCFSFVGYAQDRKQVKAEILFDNALLEQMRINTKFINSIEYTSDGFLLLSSADQFYLLGIGGMVAIFENWKSKTDIESFTVTADGVLMMVSGNTLYKAHSQPSFIKVLDIPDSDMGITSKYKDVYVYDRIQKSNKKEYSIYQISKDKKNVPLVTVPTPILSVFELPSLLIFSTKNTLLCVDIKTKKFYPILMLPHEDDIISIAGDTINHAFYFSTDQTVYRIKNDKKEIISKDFGGILKYDEEGLLIFNPDKKLIVRFRNNLLYSGDLSKLELSVNELLEPEKLTRSLKEPRNLILTGQIPQAIQRYSQLVNEDERNPALLSEYAYTLALGGIYEGALMNLDRAKLFGAFSRKDCFYAGQVFALMRCDQPAVELLTRSSVPKWIYPKYNELYQKYKSRFTPQGDDIKTLFNRINYLSSAGMNFQSIALYEQILEENPNAPISHIGYSIPLEKAGLYKLAAEELETGILLMPDEPQFSETKQAFNQRLAQLRQQPEKTVSQELQKPSKFNPKTMLYAGGMFSKDYTSFNARFGVYLSKSFNGSLNLGVSGNSTTTSVNLGFSGYQRLGNVLVIGLGLNDQINKDNNVLSAVPSLGLSFINSKKNSSWDVFFNLYYPLQEGASTLLGISVGKSFYWGER